MHNESLPDIIDNNTASLSDIINKIAPGYQELSIATGYWDLAGTLTVIENIKNYTKIRLLIGKEPLASNYAELKASNNNLFAGFPEDDLTDDLANISTNSSNVLDDLRNTAKILAIMIKEKRLEVRICRKSFLHAKIYIFGSFYSPDAIGIIGSSNFTAKGLTSRDRGGNFELNALEENAKVVQFKPRGDNRDVGHLEWFERVWNMNDVEEWTGDFSNILRDSPVGDLTFGPYDMYIKSLMTVFPDELIDKPDLGERTNDILYSFQNRNAGILINKLAKMGTAILADSVGLGKTITAGAIIKHYIEIGKKNIVVLPPASLKQQWKEDLATTFGLREGSDFQVISQQDINAISNLDDLYKRTNSNVDLFIIDEAHNLRNPNSTRYESIMSWLQNNMNAHVLLLTATPINNSLNDLVNQIQLGLKGEMDPVMVPYKDPRKGRIETIEFFEALNRIQRRSKSDNNFDWESVRETLVSGISHYLVRSTRQGVEQEGGIINADGHSKTFPHTKVEQVTYQYSHDTATTISEIIEQGSQALDGINPLQVNIDDISNSTQRTSHPIDIAKQLEPGEKIIDIIPNLFQLILLMGFTPYKPEMYQYRIHNHSVEDINSYALKGDEKIRIKLQLSIHNMLCTTWLKRLESSTAALRQSVISYQQRLEKFEDWLDRGFILSLSDIAVLENDYGDDIEQAFNDYDAYNANTSNTDDLKKHGVRKCEADNTKYDISAITKDIARDKIISQILIRALNVIDQGDRDDKLTKFADFIKNISSSNRYGNKILIFSFFADTIEYLKNKLPEIVDIPNFKAKSQFLSGKSGNVDDAVKRFSPHSKKYQMKDTDQAIDYLFATDILSEGQNLQDAGILVNYDLHWNPVRMIQRNGRINRLGSKYDEVLIANMRPENNLEQYLKLVARLQSKIDTIKNTVGLDQGILSTKDINPMEFVDDLSKLYSGNSQVASDELARLSNDDKNDILSWTNDHVFVLRDFLAHHNKSEIDRIKSIPMGKWGYAPKTSHLDTHSILSLQATTGITSITNEPMSQTFFIKTDTSTNEFVSEVISDYDALSAIKTTPSDNSRQPDNIHTDRILVERRASRIAVRKASSGQKQYELKGAKEKALSIMQDYYPNLQLRPIIEKGLRDSMSIRSFEKLVRIINRECRDNIGGKPGLSTIAAFNELVNHIKNRKDEEISNVDGKSVLFYASNNL